MSFDDEKLKELRKIEQTVRNNKRRHVFGDPLLVWYHQIMAECILPTLDELRAIVAKTEAAAVARLEGL